MSSVSCYLPQVEPHDPDAVVFVDLRISGVLRVVNLGVDPLALVSRVVDLPGLPLSLRKRTHGLTLSHSGVHSVGSSTDCEIASTISFYQETILPNAKYIFALYM